MFLSWNAVGRHAPAGLFLLELMGKFMPWNALRRNALSTTLFVNFQDNVLRAESLSFFKKLCARSPMVVLWVHCACYDSSVAYFATCLCAAERPLWVLLMLLQQPAMVELVIFTGLVLQSAPMMRTTTATTTTSIRKTLWKATAVIALLLQYWFFFAVQQQAQQAERLVCKGQIISVHM